MDAYLVQEPGSETERNFSLAKGHSWTIGRSEGCAVLLNSRAVSRVHALIQRVETGDYCFIDLGSRNGSYVNGRRVGFPITLKEGDRLSVADQHLTFRCPSPNLRNDNPVDSQRGETVALQVQASSATILVVDIRDFTPLARALSEDLLSQTIGSWFLRVGQIAVHCGSWAQKYIGDAVMAVWLHDAHRSAQKDLLEVLHAVCEIRKSTAELHKVLPLPRPLRIGAGINTGPVIIGAAEYTALGDVVNAAFRLESATKTVGRDVVMGHSTFQTLHVADAEAPYFERREVELKGYDTLTTAWATSFEKLEQFVRAYRRSQTETGPLKL